MASNLVVEVTVTESSPPPRPPPSPLVPPRSPSASSSPSQSPVPSPVPSPSLFPRTQPAHSANPPRYTHLKREPATKNDPHASPSKNNREPVLTVKNNDPTNSSIAHSKNNHEPVPLQNEPAIVRNEPASSALVKSEPAGPNGIFLRAIPIIDQLLLYFTRGPMHGIEII